MSSPSISLQDVISQCQNQRWEEMPMHFPFKDPAPLILMVACRQTHEENSEYSLEEFNDKLLTTIETLASLFNCVNLADFLGAYILAKIQVKDDQVAAKIDEYVKKHAAVLGWMLQDESVPEEIKKATIENFPFITEVTLTPKEEIPNQMQCVVQ
ncbi:MAG: hypothetical protein COT84_04890 [Chlamydiae bacterium CG10_big_fil_rev_8_21_14_0_10_35_9]|nr:MAG: hypothetical protein COT84_04890 [Chlamydiae bacterium CG10_big_fil_rev_8_21_14_0_10_35_9]